MRASIVAEAVPKLDSLSSHQAELMSASIALGGLADAALRIANATSSELDVSREEVQAWVSDGIDVLKRLADVD